MSKEGMLSVLEAVLGVNGAALVYKDGLYRVVPTAQALRNGAAGADIAQPSGAPGYRVRVIPLQYIAAEEMSKILEPFVDQEQAVRVDSSRNLLVVAGSAMELEQISGIVELFDVNWLQGMSVGLLPVRHTPVEAIATELNTVLGIEEDGPARGVLRILPMQRLNAVMVITPQLKYLEDVRAWIARLDVPGDGEGRQLYVYKVQNGRAADLAGLLQELFNIETSGPGEEEAGPPELAPWATPKLVQLRPGDASSAGADSPATNVIRPSPEAPPPPAAPAAAPRRPGGIQVGPAAPGEPAREGETALVAELGRVSIVADPSRNSLLILAIPSDYAKLEAALQQLDVSPMQVLLEATIVDVNLSGELAHGVQWFFDHRIPQTELLDDRLDFRGFGTVGLPLGFPGTFSYSIVNAASEVRALLNILATEDKVRVVASPSVLVLDNETATIRVGDQVPISTTVVTEGGVVSNSVQFKDTGVTLDVTPQVNDSGLVTLDISQELTDTGAIDDASGQRAFLERSVRSRVAVYSNESVVIGGLIRENNSLSESGVPFLHKLPVLGFFFGQKLNTADRTELLVVLRATVVRDAHDLRKLAGEFRRRMRGIYDEDPPPPTDAEVPAAAAAPPGALPAADDSEAEQPAPR
jgi:general secretion pathway protein D